MLIVFALILVWVLQPSCDYIVVSNGNQFEAEVKSNLHNIQLSIERFAVDHDGLYPEYLIGGQGKHSVFVRNSASAFISVQDCADRSLLADPLLRAGYIEAYPKNPFARDGAAIHRFQVKYSDPLRNGTEEAKLQGTRFGPYCTLMGNVMADFRYTEFAVFGDEGAASVFPTYADVEYPCFDMWETNKPTPYLPGEFFYKSMGIIEVTSEEDAIRAQDEPIRPAAAQLYMLGGYGDIRTKGRDVLGPEPEALFRFRPEGTDTWVERAVPLWTRSTDLRDKEGHPLGSPYGTAPASEQFAYGSPNGIRDSVILVLVPSEETWERMLGNE